MPILDFHPLNANCGRLNILQTSNIGLEKEIKSRITQKRAWLQSPAKSFLLPSLIMQFYSLVKRPKGSGLLILLLVKSTGRMNARFLLPLMSL